MPTHWTQLNDYTWTRTQLASFNIHLLPTCSSSENLYAVTQLLYVHLLKISVNAKLTIPANLSSEQSSLQLSVYVFRAATELHACSKPSSSCAHHSFVCAPDTIHNYSSARPPILAPTCYATHS